MAILLLVCPIWLYGYYTVISMPYGAYMATILLLELKTVECIDVGLWVRELPPTAKIVARFVYREDLGSFIVINNLLYGNW